MDKKENQILLDKYKSVRNNLCYSRQRQIDVKEELKKKEEDLQMDFEGKTWQDPDTGVIYPTNNAENRKAVVRIKTEDYREVLLKIEKDIMQETAELDILEKTIAFKLEELKYDTAFHYHRRRKCAR